MASVTFNLKAPKKLNESTVIRMVFAFGKEHIIMNTGIKVKPKEWNPEEKRLRNLSGTVNVQNMNTSLTKIENRIIACYRDPQYIGRDL